jgi:hypothetical protein
MKCAAFGRFSILALAVGMTMGPVAASARPLPGYKCMMLNLTGPQSMDPNVHVNVRSGPSATAPIVGWAGSVVVVNEQVEPTNGFLQMLQANGRRVWIAAADVRPYHSEADPKARCSSEILPNGRVGFGPG